MVFRTAPALLLFGYRLFGSFGDLICSIRFMLDIVCECRVLFNHQGLGDGAGVGNVGVHAALEQDDAGPGPLQRVREG